jgi:hypothetical protein
MAEFAFKGGDRLKVRLDEMARNLKKGASVRVGFLEGATYSDGTSVPMVAAIQEFGAPSQGIPPRPYFRQMIQANAGHWGDDVAGALKHTDFDAARALHFIGELLAGELRQSIIDVTEPELSKVTLLLRERFWTNPGDIKFSDVREARADIAMGAEPSVSGTQAKPLVWSGHLLNSVDYEVEEK